MTSQGVFPESSALDQYVEEAALLWLRRDLAVQGPRIALNDLIALDGRLEAHLDGLRVAEAESHDSAWAVCERELRWGEEGELFAAAALAFEGGKSKRIERVLEAANTSHAHARPVVSALAWLETDAVQHHIDALLQARDARQRRIGLAALAVRRRLPPKILAAACEREDGPPLARALRAAGEMGQIDLAPLLRNAMTASDESVQASAAWSLGLLRGEAAALRHLQRSAVEDTADGSRALQLACRRLPLDGAARWIEELDGARKTARLAVIAAGLLGDPRHIPWLLDRMQCPELARAAGEALSTIVGMDLPRAGMEGKRPEDFPSGPSEDAADDNVAMDPDENLPWPDRERIVAWWKGREAEFAPGTRYLLGRPITEKWLEQVLRRGYQRQRAAAALELAIQRPGTPLFEVRAPGFHQHDHLG